MNIALVTLRQKITPAEALGRVNASARVCIMSSLPIGALMISSLAEAYQSQLLCGLQAWGNLWCIIHFRPHFTDSYPRNLESRICMFSHLADE